MNDGEVKGCLKSTNTPNGIIFLFKRMYNCRICRICRLICTVIDAVTSYARAVKFNFKITIRNMTVSPS